MIVTHIPATRSAELIDGKWAADDRMPAPVDNDVVVHGNPDEFAKSALARGRGKNSATSANEIEMVAQGRATRPAHPDLGARHPPLPGRRLLRKKDFVA